MGKGKTAAPAAGFDSTDVVIHQIVPGREMLEGKKLKAGSNHVFKSDHGVDWWVWVEKGNVTEWRASPLPDVPPPTAEVPKRCYECIDKGRDRQGRTILRCTEIPCPPEPPPGPGPFNPRRPIDPFKM